MGIVNNIDYDNFPKQGDHLNKKVEVYFKYDTSKALNGIIVRDDMEEPFEIIIKLDNGRYLRASECQYSWRDE